MQQNRRVTWYRQTKWPYEPTWLDEKKRAIKLMVACLIIGALFITFSSAIFFGYCRPFTKFEYHECIVKNEEWFKIENAKNHVKVIYYVYGVKYEKKMRSIPVRRTKICFYYNVNNPNDTISGDRKLFLVAMPIIAGFGGLFIIFGTKSFLKWKKKDEKEFLKWQKDKENNKNQSLKENNKNQSQK